MYITIYHNSYLKPQIKQLLGWIRVVERDPKGLSRVKKAFSLHNKRSFLGVVGTKGTFKTKMGDWTILIILLYSIGNDFYTTFQGDKGQVLTPKLIALAHCRSLRKSWGMILRGMILTLTLYFWQLKIKCLWIVGI